MENPDLTDQQKEVISVLITSNKHTSKRSYFSNHCEVRALIISNRLGKMLKK